MLASKRKEWVLETVDMLRQRKARPDKERICRMLDRLHGLTPEETHESLDALVNDGEVVKVHFKGNVSYRRPLRRFKGSENLMKSNNYNTSHRITHAIKTITKQTGDGVTFEELEQWLISKNPETRLVKHRLEKALQKEINSNMITRLSDGCFVTTESLPKEEKTKELKPNLVQKHESPKTILQVVNSEELIQDKVKDDTIGDFTNLQSGESTSGKMEAETSTASVVLRRGRPPSKRKKIKKTHGPDFANPLKRKRMPSKDNQQEVVLCDYCSHTAESNRDGKPEPLLTCKDCNNKAHPSCLDYSEELAKRALNSPWQCMDCKTCCICDGSENADLILFCDACDKGYHMTCHSPAVPNKPKGKWVCSTCKKNTSRDKNPSKTSFKQGSSRSEAASELSNEEEDEGSCRRGRKRKLCPQKSTVEEKSPECVSLITNCTESLSANTMIAGTVGAPCLPTPCSSPRPSDTFDYEMKMALSGTSVPVSEDSTTYTDASSWNIDDVFKFFEDCGFKEQASCFKDQEIDGPSLLLMRRDDVLTALGMRLGPALKIYHKIVRLQQHSQS